MTGTLPLALAFLLSSPGAAADEFLTNLHKADSRSESEERIEYYSRAIRAWRTFNGASLLAHCHYNRGESYLSELRLDEAETDLTKAISLDPGNPRAFLLRGRLCLRTGRANRAEQDFKEYVALKPEDPEGLVLRAQSRERTGKLADAMKDCQRALHLDAESWPAFLCLARGLTIQRKYAAAGQMLDKAEAVAGKRHAAVTTHRGMFLAATLRFEEAVEALGAGIGLYEDEIGELQRSVGKPLELQDLRESLALAYHARGGLHEKRLEAGPALSDYRESCRLGHPPACSKATELAKRPPPPQAQEPPAPEPPPKPPVEAPPKRKRGPKPPSDPGERIYGS
ncbi:MAG: tetratricopeptide repeat protein [Elusimicrobia bacterium]|nr:tetratricopeptide repeat protein [Elusimicrobiota bacterium]